MRGDDPSPATRQEGEAAFREETLLLSASLGEAAAKDRTRRDELEDAIASDDGPAMLAALDRGEWSPDEEFMEPDLLPRDSETRDRWFPNHRWLTRPAERY